jgi:hypothetical protein
LAAGDLVLGHQHTFDDFDVLGGFLEPLQDGVFFVVGRASEATNPIAFGQVGQSRENLFNRCSAPVKECAFRFRKGLPTGSAFVTLPTGFGVTKLDDGVLVVSLSFPIVSTFCIGTEIAYVYQVGHSQLLSRVELALPNSTNTQEGDYHTLENDYIQVLQRVNDRFR